MAPFLERLASDGHELTIFDTGSDEKPASLGFNSTIIHVNLPSPEILEQIVTHALWRYDFHSAFLAFVQYHTDAEMGRIMRDAADKLTLLLNSDYDLVIVDEIFSVHGMTIASMLKKLKSIPYIIFATNAIGPESNTADLAMGHSPVVDSNHGTFFPTTPDDAYDPRRFYYRAYNVVQTITEMMSFWFIVPKILGYNSPGKLTSIPFETSRIIKEAEIHLRENYDRIGRIVPQANDFRSIGSYCKPFPKLEGELKDFVEDKNSKGTIYLAFGSIVRFDNCPEFIFDALFSALNEFREYRIIMSMKPLKNRTLPPLNDHVKILSWVPQYALLAHEKTKLFMSHGGLKSFKEAFCTKTPVIILPIFAEQGVNARNAIRYKIGSALNKYTLTKNHIIDEFKKITNPIYEKNIIKYSNIHLDRIIPSLDEGNWIVRKIFSRIKIFKNKIGNLPDEERSLLSFRRRGMSQGWIQYYNLDFFGLVLITVCILYK